MAIRCRPNCLLARGARSPLKIRLPPRCHNWKKFSPACINLLRDLVPEDSSKPSPEHQPRSSATIVAAGLLLAALALVVVYTSRRAFLSPVALVVVAAIGVAALLLQIRLRPELPSSSARSLSTRRSLWTNLVGV